MAALAAAPSVYVADLADITDLARKHRTWMQARVTSAVIGTNGSNSARGRDLPALNQSA